MNEAQKTIDFLFTKMKRLYPTFVRPDEIDVMAWTEILEGYSQTDILEALKNYRKNVPYNVAPLPAKFKEYLPERHKHAESTAPATLAKGDFAWERMNSDIEAGSCRNNLYVYRDAERIVLNDWLAREIPASIWCKMSYASKLQQAKDKGLLSNFDEALKQAAQARFKRDYEFHSANDIANTNNKAAANDDYNGDIVNYLGSHWRV